MPAAAVTSANLIIGADGHMDLYIDNGGKFGFSSASPQQQGGNEGLVDKKVLVYGQWKGGTVHFISSRKGGKRLCERFAGLVEYRYFLY